MPEPSLQFDSSDVTWLQLEELAEGQSLECQRASGRDGQGELPRSFYESYSAMANTTGGVVLLGVEEKPPGQFAVTGVKDPQRLLVNLWNGLNDRDQISRNLLTSADVTIEPINDERVIRIQIPRAGRTDRPIHVGRNPMDGTFRRNHTGDYRCDVETVRRMIAESAAETRDGRVLPHSTLQDIDPKCFQAYRTLFRDSRPGHPWLQDDDTELLRKLGGWARDRESGNEGLTIAGLLMFGQLRSILDFIPTFVVDYQERTSGSGEITWVDRITTDGTWSGNLFDFYRRTIQRLFDGLRVPFRLSGVTRVDETPVHVALREALVNSLIHADFAGTIPILVLKQPGLFSFRNPGTMRVPPEDAVRGGTSDCRNRNLQKMFQLAGLGEQSGAGVTRIIHGWREQHWRAPEINEDVVAEQTSLTLRTISLLPDDVVALLTERLGATFQELSVSQRLALVTAEIEGQVTHARLRSMSDDHPADLSKALSTLVRLGYLQSAGLARGTVYFPPIDRVIREGRGRDGQAAEGDVGSQLDLFDSNGNSLNGDEDSQYRDLDSLYRDLDSQYRDLVPFPEPEDWTKLASIARPFVGRQRLSKATVRHLILRLCLSRSLTSGELARLLNRNSEALRHNYLSPLVREGHLSLRFPDQPNHPHQSYLTRFAQDVEEPS
jgi:ATP-dependent DNA helicase RecG